MTSHLLLALPLLVFPAMLVVAALRDVTSYTIPNWISLALIAAYPVAALAAGLPLGTVGLTLAVGIGALAAAIAFFALNWIGGGDAKLFAAAALWLGLPAMPAYLLFTALAGGVLTLALISLRSPLLRPMVLLGPPWFARLAEPKEAVPYGVAIAAGGLAAFPSSPLMTAFPALTAAL